MREPRGVRLWVQSALLLCQDLIHGFGAKGQVVVNAGLNCLSLEICPHGDTWIRCKGHTVRNRLKEEEESLVTFQL